MVEELGEHAHFFVQLDAVDDLIGDLVRLHGFLLFGADVVLVEKLVHFELLVTVIVFASSNTCSFTLFMLSLRLCVNVVFLDYILEAFPVSFDLPHLLLVDLNMVLVQVRLGL